MHANEADFQAHLTSPGGAPFNAALQPLIQEKESALTSLSPLG